MASEIEVRVAGRGVVRGDTVEGGEETKATCAACGRESDAVASIAKVFACADCLRERLEAMSVARFRLRADGQSGPLPWGKVSG